MAKKKPTRVLTKPIRIQWWNLFAAITKGVVQFNTGQWSQLSQSAFDGFDAIRGIVNVPSGDAGEQAIALIQKAINTSIVKLVIEQDSHFRQTKLIKQQLAESLDGRVEAIDLIVDSSFLSRFDALPVLPRVATIFKYWCQHVGLSDADANNIAGRLPYYATLAATDELLANPHQYDSLTRFISSPIAAAVDRERKWLAYEAWLRQHIYEPSFGESFGLGQVYVWPNGFVTARSLTPATTTATKPPPTLPISLIVTQLRQWLDAWLDSDDNSDCLRFVSGGPGSGKSSFAKMYAAEVCRNPKYRVLLIPLHLVDVLDNVEAAIRDLASHDTRFPLDIIDPISLNGRRLLIIFDGLDELSTQGESALHAADQFVAVAERFLEKRNHSTIQVKAVFLGRPISIQNQQLPFREIDSFFQILPFFVPEDRRSHYRDVQRLLDIDLRDIWWKHFGQVIQDPVDCMPEELHTPVLLPLSVEPFLNFLIARLWAIDRKSFTHLSSVNELYARLIEHVTKRTYQKNQVHPTIQSITSHEYIRLLEEIAVSAWQSNGRIVKRTTVNDRLQRAGLGRYIELLALASEKGLAQLLVSFYFRRASASRVGDDTYEFTHKSFSEYLTAKRIVRLIIASAHSLIDYHQGVDRGKNEMVIWEEWLSIFDSSYIDADLMALIWGELRLLPRDEVLRVQSALTSLLEWIVRDKAPLGRESAITWEQARTRVMWPTSALLHCISGCAFVTGDLTKIGDPNTKLEFLIDLLGNNRQLLKFEGFDFSDSDLSNLNLSFAVLDKSSFAGAFLLNINLTGASLADVNFAGAHLEQCDLRNVKDDLSRLKDAKAVSDVLIDRDKLAEMGKWRNSVNVSGRIARQFDFDFHNKFMELSEAMGETGLKITNLIEAREVRWAITRNGTLFGPPNLLHRYIKGEIDLKSIVLALRRLLREQV